MTPRPPAVIGLDIGTSAVKGVLVDARPAPVAGAARAYSLDLGPGGRVEVDAEAVAVAALGVVAALAARARRAGLDVRAICAGGSGDEAAWLDAAGRPVAPVPMSLDGRSEADGEAIAAALGAPVWMEVTGLPVAGAYPLARLRWLGRTDPAAAARVRHLLAWPELVAHRLGVAPASEPTLAARSGGYRLGEGRPDERTGDESPGAGYDPGVLAVAGAGPSLLPRLVRTGAVIGTIPGVVGGRLGLGDGVVVVAGGFDQAMATLGAGVRLAGIAHVGAGSWEAVTLLADHRPAPDLVLAGFSIGPSIAAGGRWSVMGSGPGSSPMAWLGRLGAAPSAEPAQPDPGAARRAVALAARAPDRPTGLLVIPDLDGAPPPAPDRAARAVIAGLGIGHGAQDIARAMLEGVAMELAARLDRLAAAGLAATELRMTGGGSRSRRMLQLRADVTGLPVRAVRPVDAGTTAAAALALAALGLSPDAGVAVDALAAPGSAILPRPDAHDAYRVLRDRRDRLVADLAEVAPRS